MVAVTAIMSGSAAGALGVLAYLAGGGGLFGLFLGVTVATLVLVVTCRWW